MYEMHPALSLKTGCDSPFLGTKPCLLARFARFLARFFRAKWAGPTRLGPLRARLGQKNEPAGSDDTVRFSNRA
jgi:hypothetical protein